MSPRIYNSEHVPLFAPSGFPEMLGLNGYAFDSAEFESTIKRIQSRLGLKADGFCGPATIHAMATENSLCYRPGFNRSIIVGPKAIPLDLPTITHNDDFTLGETSSRVRKVNPTQIVIHYDVSFNARATNDILMKRGYSTHFIIDGDEHGTIYQCHDPATRVAFHAGSSNNYSIGIDINNPADVRYLKRDSENRGRERGVVSEKIHSSTVKRLDYFPEQIASLKKLVQVLCEQFDIPNQYPTDSSGRPIKGLLNGHESFRGVVGHYHLSKVKTDPSPLRWEDLFT